MNLEPIAYSIEEVAKLVGLSRSAIHTELKSGRMVGFKSGTKTLILRADVKTWVESLPAWKPGAIDCLENGKNAKRLPAAQQEG